MADLIHVGLAATAVYALAAAVLTLGARAMLTRRQRMRSSIRFADPVSVALLVAPTAFAALWVGSAIIHELEPGRVLRDCCLPLAAELGIGEFVTAVMAATIAFGGVLVAKDVLSHRHSVRDLALGRACADRLAALCGADTRLGALTDRLSVVEGLGQAAATRGLIRPRVEIDHALVARLDDDELRAVLLHEVAHLRDRDPARLVLSAVALGLNPFGAWLRPFLHQWRFARELQCDRSAVRDGADPLALAGALVTAARQTTRRATCCAAVADSSPAELRARVEFLTTYTTGGAADSPVERTPVRALVIGALAVAAAPHLLGATLAIHCLAEHALAPLLHLHG